MTDDRLTSSTAHQKQSNSSASSVAARLLKAMPTLLVLAAMGGGWMAMHHINSGAGSRSDDAEMDSDATGEVATANTLVLPKGKLDAAKLESVEAQLQTIQHVHSVPGRLRYDETMHVDVKAPMDGILAEIKVMPGDRVAAGDLIAVLRSPEIGQARAEVMRRQKELDIAQTILDREQTLAKNLQQVSAMLDQGVAVATIESEFTDRSLGAYRQEILSAYAKMRLADELIDKVKPLVAAGGVSGRVVREREAERQLAETTLRTARDQAAFEIGRAKLRAEADVAEASRQLDLARQSLEALLSVAERTAVATDSESTFSNTTYYTQPSRHATEPTERIAERTNLNASDDMDSRLEVRAPFAGSIESRGFAKNERVMRGDSLVVLANTAALTVEASIRESEWSAVALQPGAELSVMVPALDKRVFTATVRYFGREVQTDTNSVPLVARIENSEGLLRPGMFVRVTVPIGEPVSTLSIKPQSVIRHEDQQFVFLDMQNGTFKRVEVSTGRASDDWIEVTEGLVPGDLVVTNGAFLLKSELLLQGE
ncbi:MAG: efflux RND transporter periplasmic adaptor subunit [Pirellulaceae bacterium]|nr:efflux RND transporter periplasmic adaptor subunit [Pirellulaceae bacterium]